MRQAQTTLSIETRPAATGGACFTDITRPVADWVRAQGIVTGLLTLFLRHTSASLAIQENADPDVLDDLAKFLDRIAPWDTSLHSHTTEGADDMPAHIRTMLTQTSLAVPVENGRLALGTWQGLYLIEHRARAHIRHAILHLIGA